MFVWVIPTSSISEAILPDVGVTACVGPGGVNGADREAISPKSALTVCVDPGGVNETCGPGKSAIGGVIEVDAERREAFNFATAFAITVNSDSERGSVSGPHGAASDGCVVPEVESSGPPVPLVCVVESDINPPI
jgi:hypothetical protein